MNQEAHRSTQILPRPKAVLFDLFHTLVSVPPPSLAGEIPVPEILGVSAEEWQRLYYDDDAFGRCLGKVCDGVEAMRLVAHAIDPGIAEERIVAATESRRRRFEASCRSKARCSQRWTGFGQQESALRLFPMQAQTMWKAGRTRPCGPLWTLRSFPIKWATANPTRESTNARSTLSECPPQKRFSSATAAATNITVLAPSASEQSS